MGYYIRVLGTQNPDIHIDEINEALEAKGLSAKFEIDPNENLPNGQCLTSRIKMVANKIF